MALDADIKIYKFSRGTKYSVYVKIVNGGENIQFERLIVPKGTSKEVSERLLAEAESSALTMHAKERGK